PVLRAQLVLERGGQVRVQGRELVAQHVEREGVRSADGADVVDEEGERRRPVEDVGERDERRGRGEVEE
ncbi:hypothetical protein LTR16_012825, partial [Cryomyces antarcticus]